MKINNILNPIQSKLRSMQTFTELGYSSNNRLIFNARRFALIKHGVLGHNVLEIGCGTGEITRKIKAKERQIYAIDINKNYLRQIRDRSIKTFCMSGEKLDFADNYFDCVIAAEVIEHLKKPYQALAEWARVLKPGGKLIITTPNGSLGCLKKSIGMNPYHIREFGYFELKSMLNRNYAIKKTHKHFLLSIDIPFYSFIAKMYTFLMPDFMTLDTHFECIKKRD